MSDSKINKKDFVAFLGIFTFILPYKFYFFTGLFLLSISSIFMMSFPYIAGKLVDIASGGSIFGIKSIPLAAGILFGILLIQSILSYFRVILFSNVTEKAMADIRYATYSRVLNLPLSFYDKSRIGELSSRISSDVAQLQEVFSWALAELVRQTIILIVGIVLVLITAPQLSLFMLGTFPIVIVLALFFGRKIRALSKDSQEKLASTQVVVEETLQGIFTVKTFVAESFEKSRYKEKLNRVVNTALKVAWYRAGFISFIIFAIFGSIVGVMWYGSWLVQHGTMSVGDLVSFVLFTVFIGASIAGLGDLFGQVQKAVGASSRLQELLKEPTESVNQSDSRISISSIQFINVTFRYPTRIETSVLKDVSFTVNAGEKVALVGHSGAGKSTISQLILRLYEITSGQYLINGALVSSLDLEVVRNSIAVVPQEASLFGGSIAENIRYGKPNASHEEIEKACHLAFAWEFIEQFPEKLDTLVGERGIKLSGGQRQRIAIARAILKNPSLLILDEATSALDAESEFFVKQGLDNLLKNRTALIIAHRLSTVKNCDRIFVLKSGELIASGTHDFLTMHDEEYKKFVRLQNLY